MSTKTKSADIEVINQGSIYLFRPRNEAAKVHLEEHCSDATWFCGALVCEHRYAGDLATVLQRDGFKMDYPENNHYLINAAEVAV